MSREDWLPLHRAAAGHAHRHHQRQHYPTYPVSAPPEHALRSACSPYCLSSSNSASAPEKPATWYTSSSTTAVKRYEKARTLLAQTGCRGGFQAGERELEGIPTHGPCDDSDSILPLLDPPAVSTIPPPTPHMRTVPLPEISEEEDRQWRAHMKQWGDEERVFVEEAYEAGVMNLIWRAF